MHLYCGTNAVLSYPKRTFYYVLNTAQSFLLAKIHPKLCKLNYFAGCFNLKLTLSCVKDTITQYQNNWRAVNFTRFCTVVSMRTI